MKYDDIRAEGEKAIRDFSLIWPPPQALAPNLQLISALLAKMWALDAWERRWGYQIHDTIYHGEPLTRAIDQLETILEGD